MENIRSDIAFWVTIVGGILTAISYVPEIYTLYKDTKSSNRLKEADLQRIEKRRKNKFVFIVSWLVFMSIVLAYSCVFNAVSGIIIAFFVISFVAFVVHAHNASHSFDSSHIYPPKSFWQVLYKRIPYWIEDSGQTVFSFSVLKMDKSDAVEEAATIIENSYSQKTDYKVNIIPCYDGVVPLKFEEGTCGTICLIGEKGIEYLDTIEKSLEESAMQPDNLDLPIAYSYIGCDSRRLKYEHINEHYIKDFAQRLIMRSYHRSNEWIKLCEMMHKAFVISAFIALVFIVCSVWLGSKLSKTSMDPPDKLSTDIEFLSEVDMDSIFKYQSCFESSLAKLSDFTFRSVHSPKIKIWVKCKDMESNEEVMKNIFCSQKVAPNAEKTMKSVIGGIAEHNLFMLWPSKNKTDEKVLIWTNKGEKCNVVDNQIDKENKVVFQKPNARETADVYWQEGLGEDESLIIYGFSYDGKLAVELDFNNDDNWRKTRKYLQTSAFQNEMRVFYAAVACELLLLPFKESQEKSNKLDKY